MADQTVAYDDDRQVLKVLQERAMGNGFTHKFTIDYTDINNAAWTTDGDTATVALFTTPADWAVLRAAINVTTAFANTGTLTVAVGTDGDVDNFINEVDAKTAGPTISAAGGAPVTLAGSFGAAADTLVAQFATQGATGSLSEITAGSVDVYLEIASLNEI